MTANCLLFQVKNVDQVLVCHEDYLSACMKDCMLTNPTLLKVVNELLAVCVKFCEFFLVSFGPDRFHVFL